MSQPSLFVNDRPLRLGPRIGKGGEGEVYKVDGDPALAVKIYTAVDRSIRESKITAMVTAELAAKAPLVAFPVSITRRSDGNFAGFLMRLVGNHQPLHELYSPGSRKTHFPQADYRFLVRAAANISRAIASVHAAGCVVGDINHSGILVSSKATVALIDADSFQFVVGNHTFRCLVGVPEYTPPELQGQAFSSVVRTPNHDAFGLAVVVFQLLFMGRHPFVGTVRKGDIPPLHEAIRDHRYVYDDGRNVGMDQPPGTPALDRFHPPLANAFDQAFRRESRDHRPTALQWVTLLSEFERSLVACDENPLHFVPSAADDCAWCELERQTGSVLFLPYVRNVELLKPSVDPGAHQFDLNALWQRIEAIAVPSLPTDGIPNTVPPSAEAESAKSPIARAWAIRILAVASCIGLVIFFPEASLLWVGIAWLVWAANPPHHAIIGSAKFESRYLKAEADYKRAREDLERRAGIPECLRFKRDLEQARDQYRSLAAEEMRQLNAYRDKRRERHLHAYLDSFDIKKARIKGIGPAKLALLISFGIDTAADIERSKLLSLVGFGPSTAQPLLDWRATIERRFVYSEQSTDSDRRELARIRSAVQAQATAVRKTLAAGPQNLSALVSRARTALANPQPELDRARESRDQAASDLVYLGFQIPRLPSNSPPRSSPATSSARAPQSAPTGQSCPRCGSSMVRRTAKRGRNAGGQFWGCSRYPRCKGTRSI